MSQLSNAKVREIMNLLLNSVSVRKTAATVGVSPVTVTRYRKIIQGLVLLSDDEELPRCKCGGELGHQGWCKWRYDRSERRQRTLKALHERQRKRRNGQ